MFGYKIITMAESDSDSVGGPSDVTEVADGEATSASRARVTRPPGECWLGALSDDGVPQAATSCSLTTGLGQQLGQTDFTEGEPLSDVPDELPTVIPINVGGYRFMTRLSTLRKYADSMLAVMFSGRHKLDRDKHGYYFIDSNGTYFGYILDFLRHETLPPGDSTISVYKEASYYNISPLVEKLQTTPAVAKMIVRDAHRSQFPDYYGFKQKVIRQAMDNAIVDQTGEVILYAFKKLFTPRAPYFNPSHDCTADSAHIQIGPWDSPADEEVLIRCLEQDLQADGFHIKSHEQRRRCKYYNGQSCQKSVYKITFIFN